MALWRQASTDELYRDIVLDIMDLWLGRPHALAAQGFMNLLCGKRQVRREHDIAVRDHLKSSPQHGG